MKLTIKYIPLIVNKSQIILTPPVVAAARCQLCKHNSGYDDRYIYCTEITGGSVGLEILALHKNWCQRFEYQETKYTQLL